MFPTESGGRIWGYPAESCRELLHDKTMSPLYRVVLERKDVGSGQP